MGEEGTNIICASCGAELQPGDRFCDQCGGEVEGSEFKVQGSEFKVQGSEFKVEAGSATDPVAKNGLAGSATDPVVGEGLEGATKVESGGEVWGMTSDECRVTNGESEHGTSNVVHRTLNPQPSNPQPATFQPSTLNPEPRTFPNVPCGESDCEHFRFEVNEARLFMEGRESSFNFRITALNAEAAAAGRLRVRLELGTTPLEKSLPFGFKSRTEHELNIPHTPQQAGVGLNADVMFEYWVGTKHFRFGTNFLWTVLAAQNQHKQIDNLVVNLKMDANYAADQEVHLLENLGRKDSGVQLGSELERLDLPPRWLERPLNEIQPEASRIYAHALPPSSATLETLTLHLPCGRRIHVLHGPCLKLGRRREENHILLRVFGPDMEVNRNRSMMVSQFHLRFEWRPQGLFLGDGGEMGASSSSGTYLDGQRLGPHPKKLAPKSSSSLGVGSADPTGLNTLRLRCGPMLMGAPERPAWTWLRRQDGWAKNEFFLLLDGSCELREVQADFPDLTLSRCREGFEVRGRYGVMQPGQQIPVDGQMILVSEYQPAGLSPARS